ncbi:hypothetical protein CFP65_0139 [Kitasatospora sp. MMS16-BH015]|uniref:hypothetical protein n=1 Tax=Kitasatospora sp. MMS16-BH015 TaxID=2018025 RepID=UPI000CA36470|nr:hypothetical protein [Kitasatospora sp. MMS16-BH015]AUG75123.1 hypothetical protein CFP65_0139 [Kitasatospora sp. MMS16-BH015]
MPTSTAHEARLRRLAETLADRHRTPIELLPAPDHRRWTLRWYDGPTIATIRTALDAAGPAGAEAAARRDLSTRALALAAIRETRAGAMRRWVGSWGQRYHLEQLLHDQPHPERTAHAREAAMLERLLRTATTGAGRWAVPDESRAFELVARDGIAWLLPQPLPQHRLAAPGVTDGLALDPLEFLTARYATGVHRTAWETALTTMPLRSAVAAVQADPAATPEAAEAALALLPALEAQLTGELAAARSTLTRAAAQPR